ncbi:MAG: PAS domain S-box protein [bacterium]|nr:PAS domain S-box protein [bacterium]
MNKASKSSNLFTFQGKDTFLEMLLLLLKQIQEIFLVIDDKGYILDGSDSIETIFGKSLHSVKRKPLHNFLNPEDFKKISDLIFKFQETNGNPSHLIIPFLNTKNGHLTTQVQLIVFPLNLNPRLFLFFFKNSLDQMGIKKRFEELERLLQIYIEYSHDLLTIINPEGIILFATKGIEKHLGYSIEDFIQHSIYEFVYSKDQQKLKDAIQNCLQSTLNKHEIYFRYVKINGGLRLVQCSCINLLNHPQVAGILLQTKDITDSYQFELEQKKSLATLHTSTKQCIHGLLICTANDYECIDTNEQFTQLTGYSSTEIIGKTLFETKLFPEIHRIEWFIQNTSVQDSSIQIETQIQKKDLSLLNVSLNIEIVEIKHDFLILMSIHDITEFVQTRNEHELFLERIRHLSKMESLGVLAGGIAHDFNNILAGILGFAELAELYTDVNSPIYEYLQKIQEAGKRAAFLSNQMLLYTGQSGAEFSPLDLVQMVKHSKDHLLTLTGKNVVLEFQLSEDPCFIYGNELLLVQMLEHLVNNASEAISFGGGTIEIRVEKGYYSASERQFNYFHEYLSEGNVVILSVKDSGCGMDRDTLLKIFDPFYTTKFTGRGLGLSAVAGICRSHRAAIQVKTQPGYGSTFRILFPALD